ncbi:MAG: hypothetical protein RL631_1004 [Pseudomonadota bacterium]|jgi:hypothetical protein
MPVILHGDGLHKLYVGTAGRGQVRKNPYAAKLSKKITIRLDEDSISFFKEISEQLGIPYQNIPINSGISASRKQGLA